MASAAPTGGDLSRLRQLNSLAVFAALRADGPLTLTAVAERTGLSRPSTKDVVDQLVQLGWVVEVAPSAGTIGRPARRYRFRAEAGHIAGIDLGVHTVRAVVSDLDGAVLAETRQAVTPATPADERIAAAERAVEGCLTMAGLAREDLWTVAAGTTGIVDDAGVVRICAGIPGWAGVDLTARLGELFSCPIEIDNDARLAALAERELGVAKGIRDAVFVHAGRRTGAALVIGGEVHRGFGGAAGEVGLHPVAHWERSAGHIHDCPSVPTGVPSRDAARYTFAAARDGDAAALAAVDSYCEELAVGVSVMVMTLDPELVVLGGGFSPAGDVLLPRLRSRLEAVCLRMPELRASTLGEECVAVGAVRRAVTRLDAKHFGLTPGGIAPAR
ncbi:ROK family protein [Streptomyces boninensis]|uniref:ROK family transcriptional regulator n=1 Tax=Streptomyces boninensis TaxID=2039455 RepID=UPI003B20D7F6